VQVGRSGPAGPDNAAYVELRLAGTFRVVRDGTELTDGEIGSRKSRTLLKLLAVERPALVPVDRISYYASNLESGLRIAESPGDRASERVPVRRRGGQSPVRLPALRRVVYGSPGLAGAASDINPNGRLRVPGWCAHSRDTFDT
jgi:hypothetical protein